MRISKPIKDPAGINKMLHRAWDNLLTSSMKHFIINQYESVFL